MADLEAIRQRYEAASPCRWGYGNGDANPRIDDFFWAGPDDWAAGSLIEHWRDNFSDQDWQQMKADAIFAVHAHQDIPALLADNAALRATLTDVRGMTGDPAVLRVIDAVLKGA